MKRITASLLLAAMLLTSTFEPITLKAAGVSGNDTITNDAAFGGEPGNDIIATVSGNDVPLTVSEDDITPPIADEENHEKPEASKTLEVSHDPAVPEAPDSAKAAGSNGICYDDVAYLSASTVQSMDEELRQAYYQICDEIAVHKENGDRFDNAVIALDADATLYYTFSIPMEVIAETQSEMVTEFVDDTLPGFQEEGDYTEDIPAEELNPTGEPNPVKEPNSDEVPNLAGEQNPAEAPNLAQEPNPTEAPNSAGEQNPTEAPNSAGEQNPTEAPNSAGELNPTEAPNLVGEPNPTEAPNLPGDPEETETVIPAASAPKAENMDLLPVFEPESFEEPESVRVEPTLDLGYGTAWEEQTDYMPFTVISNGTYFYSQLTAEQKQIYALAQNTLLKGNNTFTYTCTPGSFDWEKISRPISALMLTYPDKMDWVAKPGYLNARYRYQSGSSRWECSVSVEKSKYYSSSLNSNAGNQIQVVASEAMEYAADNYPESPVYGIVKYYDQWICQNNYYNMTGTWNVTGQPDSVKRTYYYCHSAYGILLEGYGVCESYAKALSRLLDAVGIPNVYVVGDAGGGHAWNYVQMPDGNWYMVDSTWNDSTDPGWTVSSGRYLLVPRGDRKETGTHWNSEKKPFTFPKIASQKYTPIRENFLFEQTEYSLLAKEKVTLSYTNSEYVKNARKVWSSSNTAVCKVDKNGKVTAVAPGTATITLAAAGIIAECTIYVDQVKKLTVEETNKASASFSLGINASEGQTKDIALKVDMGNSAHTAQWLWEHGTFPDPKVTNTRAGVAGADVVEIKDNQILLRVQAKSSGSSNIKVTFAGKTATLKVSAGFMITDDMFEITWPDNMAGSNYDDRVTTYTGKAIKPKVKKRTDAEYKSVSFKVTYVNNKNAGTAKIVVTGKGKYGGVLEYPFEILPVDISDADFSKSLKDKVYNGGSNPPATTVKLGKKVLKADRDYKILYTGNGYERAELTQEALPAGSYVVTIEGKGNYKGTLQSAQTYTVKKNTIAKVKAAGSSNVKYTGKKLTPITVKIGKNILPDTDYDIVYHQGTKDGRIVSAPLAKGKYVAVITIKGDNLTVTAKKQSIIKTFTVK